ncbi:hypothetical protein [Nonomuraea basaltis]|uniref:hypothetical protein n=1 Tax=Nonomuraea basaltis TaxID=2495887 RepID=UPI00197CBECA|nr:hypothetical protein [Nonomuraea basaltis]
MAPRRWDLSVEWSALRGVNVAGVVIGRSVRGAALLHKIADRVRLTEALAALWPARQSSAWRDRAHVLVSLAAAIACGPRSLLEAERLQAHQMVLLRAAPSDSHPTHRTQAGLDEAMLIRTAKARAGVRRHVWQLLHLRPSGFPLAHRGRQAAARMDRHRHRRHHRRLLGQERGGGHVQEDLRPSPAGLLVRQHPGIAGDAAAQGPTPSPQDGRLYSDRHVAELLSQRQGWPDGMRLLVRRVRPSARHRKNLTAFEMRTGKKYSIVATNIGRMWGIAGSHRPQWLDALASAHAVAEGRACTGKALGLRNLPSQDWTVDQRRMLAVNLRHDLDCRLRLPILHDKDGLERAEPDTMRYRLSHLPARLTAHARRQHPGAHRSVMRRPARLHRGHHGQTAAPLAQHSLLKNRGQHADSAAWNWKGRPVGPGSLCSVPIPSPPTSKSHRSARSRNR